MTTAKKAGGSITADRRRRNLGIYFSTSGKLQSALTSRWTAKRYFDNIFIERL
ncbi:hypothetical protein [Pontibaca methylaminivorans]|uniref:hypothetical protein n=1 Tax=Pontibaca methylaminivorans TaxID=515897 RepID=UPI0013563DB5|nr:hypothetical protein [Pontibaca methylaminivorans]